MSEKQIVVTKADRLAADALFTDAPAFPLTAKLHPLVSKAFARHRQAAVEAERERCAKVADKRAKGREQLFSENGASINAAKAVEAEEIATAIRNQAGDGG
jgi:hypothetical protein